MQPAESDTELRKLLPNTDSLTVDQAAQAMCRFYRDHRAETCEIDEDGDMLLYQWGDYGNGFEWNITRQFITTEEDDDEAITQLSLTLKFDSAPDVAGGNRWCSSPDEVEEFEEFIKNSPAFLAVRDKVPTSVEIDYGGV